ncbi:hypothetical protein PBS_26580 [Paraburkholderia sp. 2C]
MYWPLAIVLPLAAAAFVHLCSNAVQHASAAPLAASEVTAELARTVSFGFVDDDHEASAQSMHTNVTLQSQPL